MMARLEEFESLLVTVKIDSNSSIQQNIPQILAQKAEFDLLCQRIDSLERFVATVNENLNTMEKTIEIAEEELNVTDYSIKGLLKPLFNKSKSTNRPRSNLENGEFKTPILLKTSDYFNSESESVDKS
ncbi:biogenesis of lysosome-related organelles complex 1 subunit 4 isoform X2 [Hermetia illucens]|nr:biogenesis of lysosome-related organelles complex 1 subunit 4 isoform X2 [Hermetia illucens]